MMHFILKSSEYTIGQTFGVISVLKGVYYAAMSCSKNSQIGIIEKYYKLKLFFFCILIYFKVRVKQKLLPTLFQYGDVFSTETEY